MEIYLHLRIRNGVVCHRNNFYLVLTMPRDEPASLYCITSAREDQILSYFRMLKIAEGALFSSFAGDVGAVTYSGLVL